MDILLCMISSLFFVTFNTLKISKRFSTLKKASDDEQLRTIFPSYYSGDSFHFTIGFFLEFVLFKKHKVPCNFRSIPM